MGSEVVSEMGIEVSVGREAGKSDAQAGRVPQSEPSGQGLGQAEQPKLEHGVYSDYYHEVSRVLTNMEVIQIELRSGLKRLGQLLGFEIDPALDLSKVTMDHLIKYQRLVRAGVRPKHLSRTAFWELSSGYWNDLLRSLD